MLRERKILWGFTVGRKKGQGTSSKNPVRDYLSVEKIVPSIYPQTIPKGFFL